MTTYRRICLLGPYQVTADGEAVTQFGSDTARALLALPTPQAQSAALQTVIKQELNVRQTEELVRR